MHPFLILGRSTKDVLQISFKNVHPFAGKKNLPKIFLRCFKNMAQDPGLLTDFHAGDHSSSTDKPRRSLTEKSVQ